MYKNKSREETRPIIDRMNPFFKILILTLIAIMASIDYKPYLSSALIATGFLMAPRFSSLSLRALFSAIKGFVAISAGFVLIILLARFLSGVELAVQAVLSLGLRFILISTYSAIFVKTTDPTEFVMALIRYFHMPVRMGYAFLTAYRFLPTFREEMETIRYAHQVRGVAESRNPLVRVWNIKRYVVPMMATAVRKGIRVTMAMETRGFGKYETRTYYRHLEWRKDEILSAAGFAVFTVLALLLLHTYGYTNLGFVYVS